MTQDPIAQSQVYLNYQQFRNLYKDYQKNKFKNIDRDHHLTLLVSKSYFIEQKYSECKNLLLKLPKNSSTKVLFERQTLLFKATYLQQPNNLSELENILKEYNNSKSGCSGKPLTQFHHNSINEMMEVVKTGMNYPKNKEKIDKKKLQNLINGGEKYTKETKFEGFPTYLISKKWDKKLKKYLSNDEVFPGPITNFQLINHVFEFEPHSHRYPSRDYMNKLIFPYLEEEHYFSVSSKHWGILQQFFSGYPVKRVYVSYPRTKIDGGDNLIKTQIQYKNEKFVMQWQFGTYYNKTVIPVLAKQFSEGQLKCETPFKDFEVISSRKIQEISSPLKYVEVNVNYIKAANEKEDVRKNLLVWKYDMQKYDVDECKNEHTVGLRNLGNSCYLNSGLQLISNLSKLSNFFLTNEYLVSLNISDSNIDGSFGQTACAYADLVKRLWFSPNETRYIEPCTFKKTFGKKYQHFQRYSQEDAQQFLMFLLNCLHEDLNKKAKGNINQKRETFTNKKFQLIRDNAINYYKQRNNSKISELFNGFHFQQIMCDSCKLKTYKFEDHLMIHLQVPLDAPKLSVTIITSLANQTEVKHFEVYIKKLQKISQIINLASKHFSCEHQLFPFLYSKMEGSQPLEKDTDISYVQKKIKKGKCLLICEIIKPQPDEQIVAIVYYKQNKVGRILDISYPRCLPIKTIYKKKENKKKLLDIIMPDITSSQLHRQKSQFIRCLVPEKGDKKIYTTQYKVYSPHKLFNFNQTKTNKILGQNDLIQQQITIDNLLGRMSKQEIIDIQEGWNCDKCQKVRGARMTNKIYSVGQYLIIHLKRFTQDGKITTKIMYPINNLNMAPHISQSQTGSEMYNLQGVILHRGQLNSGHYTCACRSKNNKWIRFDDHFFEEQKQIVPDSNAYILVYEKTNNINFSTISQTTKK